MNDIDRKAETLKAIILAYLDNDVPPAMKDSVWSSAAAKIVEERLRSKSSLGIKAPPKQR